MSFFPVGGFISFLIIDLFLSLNTDLKEGSISKNIIEIDEDLDLFPAKFNLDKEINMIPVEEALILNDNTTKRRLVMDALRKESSQYIGFLTKALKDPDTETTHYAATAVTEIKRKLMLDIQELEVKYEQSKDNAEYLKIYSEVLKEYLGSGLLDDISHEKYLHIYSIVLRDLLKISKSEKKYYEEKINCDIELRKFNSAKEYCMEYMDEFENIDSPYISLMKIYFEERNKDRFKSTLKKLEDSNIKIQKDSLKIIKFWSEGI
jgi:hypothetical protein